MSEASVKRVVIGPFNRVEGDLEVSLDVAEGRVAGAQVTVPLYRGFEQILAARPPLDALVIAPRICGICSVSQSMAAAAALRGLAGVLPAANGVYAANIVHAAENMADHLSHFYLFFMPDFARDQYRDRPWFETVAARFKAVTGSASAQMLPARSRLLHVVGLLAGKWPHSLAFQPGGTTRSIDLGERMRLLAVLSDFRRFLEATVFGCSLDRMAALSTPAELEDWSRNEGRGSDFALFLEVARDLDLAGLGLFSGPFVSVGAYDGFDGCLFPAGIASPDGTVEPFDPARIIEDVSHAWMKDGVSDPAQAVTEPDAFKDGAYSWAKAPRLGDRPAEVGALARQMVAGHPLIRALVAQTGGSSVRTRVVARVLELGLVAMAAQGWAKAIRLREPFCAEIVGIGDGLGIGLVEAARGSLGHWLQVSGGQVQRYQIIAPTTWNFSPRDAKGRPGPLEQALAGTVVGELGAKAASVQHVVRSFDPCMVCTAH
jgi:hydrogenase large subunit